MATPEALADAAVRQHLDQISAVPVGSAPADFARFARAGREQMAQLVKDENITLN